MQIATDGVVLTLPERPARAEDADIRFPPAEHSPPLQVEQVRPRAFTWAVERDLTSDSWRMTRRSAVAKRMPDIGTTETFEAEEQMTIRRTDPTSARHDIGWSMGLSRGDWRPRVELKVSMTSTEEQFLIDARLSAYEDEERVFDRAWSEAFERDHL